MERIREVKITIDDEEFTDIKDATQFLEDILSADTLEATISIYIDTNKTTYEKEFSDTEDAKQYLENFLK